MRLPCAGEKPAIRAAFATQRECVLPSFAGVTRMLYALNNTIDVVGVLNFAPAPTFHFL